MAVDQSFPSLNDFEPGWADVTCKASIDKGKLLDMEDMAALKWSRKVDVGMRKRRGRPFARTYGSSGFEASMTLYRGCRRKFIEGLMEKAPTRGDEVLIGLVSFDLVIQHSPIGAAKIDIVKILGCRYLGDANDLKEGDDPDQLEITLNPLKIVEVINGKNVLLV